VSRVLTERRFEAVVLDWDGTAVPNRHADAARVRGQVESLCRAGLDIAIVSGTNVRNVDRQLAARPEGPGELHLCLNRGSEIFAVDTEGPRLVHRRTATAEEEAALTRAGAVALERMAARGLRVKLISKRLNRRKIDLIPEPTWAATPKSRINELLGAVTARLTEHGIEGLAEAVAMTRAAAEEAGLLDARVTTDAKHVEVGLTDKSDSARWIFEHLRNRGLRACDVLVVGDEFGLLDGVPGSDSQLLVPDAFGCVAVSVGVEPGGVPEGVLASRGGPDAFSALLDDQLRRRADREPPRVPDESGWTLSVEGVDSEHERAREAVLTLGDGVVGTSGSPVLEHPAAAPRVLAAGLYDGDGPETTLLSCPIWTRLAGELEPQDHVQRTLDLRAGVLHQEISRRNERLQALLLTSSARPGTVALRAIGPARCLVRSQGLLAPRGQRAEVGTNTHLLWMRTPASHGGAVAAIAEERLPSRRGRGALDRFGVYVVDRDTPPDPTEALGAVREIEGCGFERLLVEQREAWARRWGKADIGIDGDPELQLAVRLALFHLIASVGDRGESALGARGLSGLAYRGHVFWDSDVFVLPFFAATHPPAARALLEYRLRRLPAARDAARRLGRAGARFPWESARSGDDVTPPVVHDRTGRLVPIRTGELEEHIVADVAWGASCYLDWTGDNEFAAGPGLTLFVDTARYWVSRIRVDQQGRGHIDGVVGPDEYHGPVDDNAYTNVMARWNLRRAAAAAESNGVAAAERGRWLSMADALVDGYEPETQLYEQFAGFFDLEPLVIERIAPSRPVAADVLLGHDRVQGAQVVKQTDVLMLHHLVPDEVAPGSLQPNLAFYEPRTAHGSSLSPGIHAALFARVGKTEQALAAIRLASRIDLDDLTQTTGGGLHMAAMGSLWQALMFGFGGVRPSGEALNLDPRLPRGWNALELRVVYRGVHVQLRIEPAAVVVRADSPCVVRVGAAPATKVGPADVRFELDGRTWKERDR
jgi:trehalose/maltose hydrolase-like predicted phosphorylase